MTKIANVAEILCTSAPTKFLAKLFRGYEQQAVYAHISRGCSAGNQNSKWHISFSRGQNHFVDFFLETVGCQLIACQTLFS